MTRISFALFFALALGACQGAPRADVAQAEAVSAPVFQRLVALGASDVVGVGAGGPEAGWAHKLAAKLPGAPALTALGQSGWHARQLREQVLGRAVAARPDAVVVWTGVNDFRAGVPLASFRQDLEAIAAGLRPTGARIYLVNLPSLDGLPGVGGAATGLTAWQEAVREVASRHGASVIELKPRMAELLAHPEYLSADGFHPSAAGYERLAELFAEEMTGR